MRKRWVRASASVLGTALFLGGAATASAQASAQASAPATGAPATSAPATSDLVVLTSGARYRGVVVEYEPGLRVVLQGVDGTLHTFSGAEIASVQFGGEAPSAPSSAPPSSASPSSASPSSASPSSASPSSAPPSSASPSSAPPSSVVTSASAPSVTPVTWSEPRVYELSIDPQAIERRLETLAPPRREPRGDSHLGVQLALSVDGTFAHYVSPEPAPWRAQPAGGVFAFFDTRVGHRGTLRVGLTGTFGPGLSGWSYSEATSAGTEDVLAWMRAWSAGLRILGGSDLASDVTFRAGVEAAMQGGPRGVFEVPEVTVRLECSWRFLEHRTLEVGGAVAGGVSSMSTHREVRNWLGELHIEEGNQLAALVRAELYAAWVFE